MAKFIKLMLADVSRDGKDADPVQDGYFNVSHIVAFTREPGTVATHIILSGDDPAREAGPTNVLETPEQILKLIEEAK